MLATAKIFTTGKSQAVRLPKEYRFAENEVGCVL
ncbi:MAG: AbrB/MazE/SpoVT family DNA-binding domain-containing protein [Defluviitaleaceae bacterium]|nr:AbrB/MazE/SpoVT family DNA-binding domain-containing protein [Defluviitaleaceae bacterium]